VPKALYETRYGRVAVRLYTRLLCVS
jgi:hypothetical protein